MSQMVFKALRGTVRLDDDRYQLIKRGQELPGNLADGELARLKRADAVGSPQEAAAEPSGEGESSVPLVDRSDAELVEFVSSNNYRDVLDAVGDNSALAVRVLEAERTANADQEPRKSLVAGLEKVIGQ